MIKLNCQYCGKEFLVYLCRKNAKFCSLKCSTIGKNNPFYGKHHTEEFKKKISKFWNGKRKLKNNPHWQGGKVSSGNGYTMLKLPNHPEAKKSGYVFEHRIVMESKIGRYLKPHEVVHHINKNRVDNRIENLMLFENSAEHSKYHKLTK